MKFRYRAYLPSGTTEAGEVDARDRADALKSLLSAGKSVFEIEEAAGGKSRESKRRDGRFRFPSWAGANRKACSSRCRS
jgi:type II secretory pathway component PulF